MALSLNKVQILIPFSWAILSLSAVGACAKSLDTDLNLGTKGDFEIFPGQCLNETLAETDQTLNDGSYYDRFTLNWPGGDFQATLDSAAFDEYLILIIDGVQTDVDRFFTQPETITLEDLRPGLVYIFANSFQTATGEYSLCVGESTGSESSKGDLNGDGIVDAADLLALIADRLSGSPTIDLTEDGMVDETETLRLSQDWFRRSEIDIASRAAVAIGKLEEVEAHQRLADENFPLLIRSAIPLYYPEVQELIGYGSPAVETILESFLGTAGFLDDTPLLLLAYALEKIGDPSAVPVLADWLEANMLSELDWSREFVTHTLKVLTGQSELNIETYRYDVEQKYDTIAQARTGLPSAKSVLTGGIKGPSSSGEDCERRLLITGINSEGAQETLAVSYNVRGRDIDEIIAAETDPARRQKQELIKQGWISGDEEVYGNSDYVPISGAEVSRLSNCAGLVIEKIFGALSAELGIPLTLPPGQSDATSLRNLALKFGSMIPISEIDEYTVISHDNDTGNSSHVEVPVSGDINSAVIWSKDNYGKTRAHTIDKNSDASGQFTPAVNQYDSRDWWPGSSITTRFYRFDPARIVDIKLDGSRCPCNSGAADAIAVAFTAPTESETDARVITVSGTVGEPSIDSGVITINGVQQAISISAGFFSTKVVLRSGENVIGLTVETPDGRKGCTETMFRSTTPKTTISVTLTWNLGNSDVDLYVTQPDGATAWYRGLTTTIGGRLDVDNRQGYGPENYFLSSEEEDMVLEGSYTIGVHYYNDHLDSEEVPTRSVAWRVEVLLDEGTEREMRKIYNGSLSAADSGNANPGSSGPDWATAAVVDYQVPDETP